MKKLLTIMVLLPSVLLGQTSYPIVPPELERVMGNGVASAPFQMSSGNSARFQQVYAATEFSSLGEELLISALSFRVDSSGTAVRATIQDIQFDLSTTPKAPDALSPIFAENVGSDNKTVFGRGPLSVHTFPPTSGSFGFIVRLDTAFLYRPSDGNLLLDIRNFSGGDTTSIDGQITFGDSISIVRAYTGDLSGSVNSTAGITRTFGLVTRFAVTPIPEPGTASLVVLGLCVMAFVGWQRKARPKEVGPEHRAKKVWCLASHGERVHANCMMMFQRYECLKLDHERPSVLE